MLKKRRRIAKTPNDMATGTVHTTKDGKISILKYNNKKDVQVRFLETGYVTTTQAMRIRGGVGIKDRLLPTVLGVGFIGGTKYRAIAKGKIVQAYQAWHGMLRRCYDPKYHALQPTYIGCSVDPVWHNYQVFAEWFENNYVEGCQLDKDIKIKGNKVYSPDACVFVSQQANKIEAHAKSYILTSPKGVRVHIHNMRKFCKDNGLCDGHMSRVASGTLQQHKGWTQLYCKH